MIEQIRNQQLYGQIHAVGRLSTSQVATYQGRDTGTGLRLLESADGGTIMARYLRTTTPETVPLYIPGRLGLPGDITNK
jgi:hypothetical protein